MDVKPGTRLGLYEVVAPLGAGGMGEVYRATDARLGREVALKMLPEAFSAEPERLARLEREARLLASLNHPGIAHLYGFETATLDDGRSVHFLVMELAAGEDLLERLKRGAIPVHDALEIAKQIAEGLEAAHENGIVHRDLKPANIRVTPDGKVKVLDFGLAKAYASDPGGGRGGSGDLSQSPTLALAGTMAGVILGTAAYMSPEQARGKAVDKRADIWAFGVVLIEMLTGKRLFSGETVSDTLAAVLTRDPDFGALPAATPPAIRRLLRRCLQRNPNDRLHDIADARIVLDDALRGAPDEAIVAGAPGRLPRTAWMIAAGLAVALGIGAAAGWMLRRPATSDAAPGARWTLAIPDGLTLSTTESPQIAMSEDGRIQVAVVIGPDSIPRLLIRDRDEFEPRVLAESEHASCPFLSPDGEWIAFTRDAALFKISTGGGPPVRLTKTSGQFRGGTWSRDGFIYLARDSNTALVRVPASGGDDAREVTRLDDGRDERTHRWPHALPDGSAVLFTCDTQASSEFYDDARIEAVRPATGERKVILEGSSEAWYAPGGYLLFARGGSIFAVPFDLRSLEVRGTPAQVAQGVATDVSTGAVQFAAAQSGVATWIPGIAVLSYGVVWIDRKGTETIVPLPPAPYSQLALSPDGHRLALVGGQGGVSDLWVADLDRGGITRLTFGEFIVGPVWSPDGSRVAFGLRLQKRNDNAWRIEWKPADGSRDAEVLFEGSRIHVPTSFSLDGRTLLFDAVSKDAVTKDILALEMGGTHASRPIVAGPFQKNAGVISPDGRWLAYVSDEGGQPSVFVRPFPGGDGRWQISTPLGDEPRWGRDSRELFYRADGVIYRVPVETARGFSAGRPERFVDRVAKGIVPYTYSIAGDGTRILTFRTPKEGGSVRTIYFDAGFAARIGALAGERK
ncbi:MAG: serine/threonine-protein kinase [Acidobacteria bacterium]|nr:serine/threonine-protein kinase [Acidobacteriota bacterium]